MAAISPGAQPRGEGAADEEEDKALAEFKAEAQAAFENRKLQTKRLVEQPSEEPQAKPSETAGAIPSTASIWASPSSEK